MQQIVCLSQCTTLSYEARHDQRAWWPWLRLASCFLPCLLCRFTHDGWGIRVRASIEQSVSLEKIACVSCPASVKQTMKVDRFHRQDSVMPSRPFRWTVACRAVAPVVFCLLGGSAYTCLCLLVLQDICLLWIATVLMAVSLQWCMLDALVPASLAPFDFSVSLIACLLSKAGRNVLVASRACYLQAHTMPHSLTLCVPCCLHLMSQNTCTRRCTSWQQFGCLAKLSSIALFCIMLERSCMFHSRFCPVSQWTSVTCSCSSTQLCQDHAEDTLDMRWSCHRVGNCSGCRACTFARTTGACRDTDGEYHSPSGHCWHADRHGFAGCSTDPSAVDGHPAGARGPKRDAAALATLWHAGCDDEPDVMVNAQFSCSNLWCWRHGHGEQCSVQRRWGYDGGLCDEYQSLRVYPSSDSSSTVQADFECLRWKCSHSRWGDDGSNDAHDRAVCKLGAKASQQSLRASQCNRGCSTSSTTHSGVSSTRDKTASDQAWQWGCPNPVSCVAQQTDLQSKTGPRTRRPREEARVLVLPLRQDELARLSKMQILLHLAPSLRGTNPRPGQCPRGYPGVAQLGDNPADTLGLCACSRVAGLRSLHARGTSTTSTEATASHQRRTGGTPSVETTSGASQKTMEGIGRSASGEQGLQVQTQPASAAETPVIPPPCPPISKAAPAADSEPPVPCMVGHNQQSLDSDIGHSAITAGQELMMSAEDLAELAAADAPVNTTAEQLPLDTPQQRSRWARRQSGKNLPQKHCSGRGEVGKRLCAQTHAGAIAQSKLRTQSWTHQPAGAVRDSVVQAPSNAERLSGLQTHPNLHSPV